MVRTRTRTLEEVDRTTMEMVDGAKTPAAVAVAIAVTVVEIT